MDNQDKFGPAGLVLSAGMVVANRYEIQERLGAGGMGMVYLARDKELDGETVALKILLPHLALDENMFRRFRNEVLVARTLTHPNIVRTHDIGKAEAGYYYISMEYVDGISLKDKLYTNTSTPVLKFDEAIRILFQIINGVSYAHGKGIIHRDLKPANVLINSQGEVKLADFGTARFINIDTALTQTGQMMGTPDYMSPEQVKGEELSASCDVYALGIMSYELVVGKKPFIADSAVALAFKHVNEPIEKFADTKNNIPQWFEEFVFKATAKKKEDRFSSVSEMNAVLISHLPVLGTQGTLFGFDISSLQASLSASSGNQKNEDFKIDKASLKNGASDSWNFGDSSKPVVFVDEVPASSSYWKYILGLLVLLIVGHKIAAANSNGYKEKLAVNAPILLKIIGESIEPLKKEQAKNEINEREQYAKELDGFLEKDTKEAVVEKNTETISLTTQALTTTTQAKEETSTTTITTSTQEVTSTTVAVKEEPVEIAVEQLRYSGYIMFKQGEKTILDTHVSASQIGQLSWYAKLDVKANDAKDFVFSEERLKEIFTINVLDKNSNLIAKLDPQNIKKEGRKVTLSGNLQEFAAKNPSAGDYNLDLIKSKQVVVSTTISILGDNTDVKSQTNTLVSNNTLPIAKGHEEAVVLNTLATTTSTQAEVNVTLDSYRGTFNFTEKEGEPNQPKAFKLEIGIVGDKISGRASLEGYEDFAVEGKVLARGMEMELRNSTYGIRLTSGLKSEKIKGLYSFPAFKKKGSWEVGK